MDGDSKKNNEDITDHGTPFDNYLSSDEQASDSSSSSEVSTLEHDDSHIFLTQIQAKHSDFINTLNIPQLVDGVTNIAAHKLEAVAIYQEDLEALSKDFANTQKIVESITVPRPNYKYTQNIQCLNSVSRMFSSIKKDIDDYESKLVQVTEYGSALERFKTTYQRLSTKHPSEITEEDRQDFLDQEALVEDIQKTITLVRGRRGISDIQMLLRELEQQTLWAGKSAACGIIKIFQDQTKTPWARYIVRMMLWFFGVSTYTLHSCLICLKTTIPAALSAPDQGFYKIPQYIYPIIWVAIYVQLYMFTNVFKQVCTRKVKPKLPEAQPFLKEITTRNQWDRVCCYIQWVSIGFLFAATSFLLPLLFLGPKPLVSCVFITTHTLWTIYIGYRLESCRKAVDNWGASFIKSNQRLAAWRIFSGAVATFFGLCVAIGWFMMVKDAMLYTTSHNGTDSRCILMLGLAQACFNRSRSTD
ncbi:hypothetical protein NEDG_00066 [Nematocida displodere]|uniref:Uncharacterized protein n=1 Tax=Nematocida displodere TaxID=1805483 RepID=A0A177EJE5_9MICR|nr:hypothetical protein NEDG_00066 [Nematocida displodere]